jgi:rubredoxin
MAVRTVLVCDRCDNEPAEKVSISVNGTRRRLDLCTECQDKLNLPRLQQLIAEYGATDDSATPARSTRGKPATTPAPAKPYRCPSCGYASGERRETLTHCATVHGMSVVHASQAVPPHGPTIECETCGYLAQQRQGITAHRRTHRGQHAPTVQP